MTRVSVWTCYGLHLMWDMGFKNQMIVLTMITKLFQAGTFSRLFWSSRFHFQDDSKCFYPASQRDSLSLNTIGIIMDISVWERCGAVLTGRLSIQKTHRQLLSTFIKLNKREVIKCELQHLNWGTGDSKRWRMKESSRTWSPHRWHLEVSIV